MKIKLIVQTLVQRFSCWVGYVIPLGALWCIHLRSDWSLRTVKCW